MDGGKQFESLGKLGNEHCRLIRRHFVVDDRKERENVEMAVGGAGGV